MFVPNGILR